MRRSPSAVLSTLSTPASPARRAPAFEVGKYELALAEIGGKPTPPDAAMPSASDPRHGRASRIDGLPAG
jgi:hypothetical protein